MNNCCLDIFPSSFQSSCIYLTTDELILIIYLVMVECLGRKSFLEYNEYFVKKGYKKDV